MRIGANIKSPVWRTIVLALCSLLAIWIGYLLWHPGLDLRDGSHDRRRNGIWIGHGWLGGDEWFIRNGKTNQIARFREPSRILDLADELRRHHISDVFPHLCPAEPEGRIPSVDAEQVERFLDAFEGFHVIPWIGGPNGSSARLHSAQWRTAFATNVQSLIAAHPRLAGVQINIEPLTSGDTNFLQLLYELRTKLPKGKLLAVAAYPPPTRWHPYEDVHWDEKYFGEVAGRSDQLAVMMYGVGERVPETYQGLRGDWTQ